MKKTLGIFIALGGIFFLGSSFVSACGCFHDAINSVNKAGYITRGAYVYNVACIESGKTRIATLSKGTKVRIIGESAYTKIVLPDGKVGRVGNDWVASTSDRSNVPAYPTNHPVGSYCDTTDLSKCPIPIMPGESIKWTYNNPIPGGTPNPTPDPVVTPVPTPTPVVYTPPKPNVIAVTDSMKPKLNMMADNVNTKINNKYGSNLEGKLAHYKALVGALASVKSSAATLADLIDYLVSKFNERIALLELETVLDID